MFVVLICLFLVFVVLCVAEFLSRTKRLRGESSRKFVHIFIGTFVAFWPFIMGTKTVQFLSLAFLAVIIMSRRYKIFQAIHGSRKGPLGEILFAASIGLLPFISSSRLVFAAAVLHMSLADGLAGLIGTKYGKKTRFLVFGNFKSLVGSLSFAAASYAIILGFFKASPIAGLTDINWLVIILPLLVTLLETVSVFGTDNLTVPLIVAAVLNSTL